MISRSKEKSKPSHKKTQSSEKGDSPSPLSAKKEPSKKESEESEPLNKEMEHEEPVDLKPIPNVAPKTQEEKRSGETKSPQEPQVAQPMIQQRAIREQLAANNRSADEAQKSSELGETKSLKKDKIKDSKQSERTETSDKGATGTVVNPSIQSVGLGAEKAQEHGSELSSSSTISDLVNQLVESIQILKKSDSMDTILTLRHPPLLAGATVTITAFSHAKGEFNLAFANLSQQAKLFLDQKLAENSLSEAMSRKGITVHIITTSTEPHTPLNPDKERPSRDNEQQEKEEQKKRGQQAIEEEIET